MPEPIKLKLADLVAGKHKIAISLTDLVNSTNEFSVKNRPGCIPKLEGSNPKSLFLDYKVNCHLPDSDPAGHEVRIKFDTSQVTSGATAKNLDVAVSCTCPAFLYWGGQWNSYMRDALEGEPRPILTRPTERLDLRDGALICKHIKTVSERILPSVQHNIDNLLRAQEIKKRQLEGLNRETPGKLEQKQRNLKEKKNPKETPETALAPPNEELKQKFKNQIEQQHTDVVKRDEPATPEEKEHLPEIQPHQVPTPDVSGTPQTGTPVPEPEPAPVARTPQKMPKFTPEDEEAMNNLAEEPNAFGEDEEEREENKWENHKRNK